MDYDWDESEDFDDAAETEEKEEQEESEHDLDYWAEEAESSDAIAEDERITAELEDSYGVLHRALQQAVLNEYIRSNPTNACILPRWEKRRSNPWTMTR